MKAAADLLYTAEDRAAIQLQKVVRGRQARKKRHAEIARRQRLPRPSHVKPPSAAPHPPRPGAVVIKPPISNDRVLIEELEASNRALKKELEIKEQRIDKLVRDGIMQKDLASKRLAEHRTSEMKVMRNTDAIDELISEGKERQLELELKEKELKSQTKRIQLMQIEIDELKDQMESEANEFNQLGEYVKEREELLNRKAQEIITERDKLKSQEKETERLQVMIRRLEARVEDLTPETADACLSARSFQENQLMKLRDDAIEAKTKDIYLLQGQNDRLSVQIDTIEAEMEKLQLDLITRDTELNKKEKQLACMKKQAKELETKAKQSDGQHKAMEVAMSQNDNLLKCLQAQEREYSTLKDAHEAVVAELDEVKQRHDTYRHNASEMEAEAIHKTKQAESKAEALSTLQSRIHQEREELYAEMSKVRIDSRVKIETMQQELSSRREKQYQLLQKLQVAEARAHQVVEESEGFREEALASRVRMKDIEDRLREAKKWRNDLTMEMKTLQTTSRETERELKAEIKALEDQKDVLKSQLALVQQSVLQHMESIEQNKRQLKEREVDIAARDKKIDELKDRVARMVHEATREGKARAHSELKKEVVTNQLDDVRKHMHKKIETLQQSNEETKQIATFLAEEKELLIRQLYDERRGKLSVVELYAKQLKHNGSAKQQTLQLTDCRLSDQELEEICTVLSGNAHVTRLDLSQNLLSDQSVGELCKVLGHAKCRLTYLDLRKNALSMIGIRTLAAAVGKNELWKDCEIVVYKDGRVQVLQKNFCDETMTVQDPTVVLLIDVRKNDPNAIITTSSVVKKKRLKKTVEDPIALLQNTTSSLPALPSPR